MEESSMALTVGTITQKSGLVLQANFLAHTTFDLDASYPTGGYDVATALAAADKLPGHEVLHVAVLPVDGYYFGFDPSTGKLKAFAAGTGIEVAATTDLSALTGLQATVFTK
jgi:hypothetical protein